jgi:hypothetical protein
MILEYYAIRRIGTSNYLYQQGSKSSTGTSPASFDEQTPLVPRLFRKRRTAQQALTAWLKGRYYLNGDGDIDWYPVKSRKAEDMEIVPVLLTFGD